MSNCLVTKLAAVVNNENLPEIGVIKKNINTNGTPSTMTRFGGYDESHPVVLSGDGAKFKAYAEQSYHDGEYSAVGNNAVLVLTTSEVLLRIKDKYNLGYVYIDSDFPYVFSVEDFNYCEHISEFTFVGEYLVGDISLLGKAIVLNNLAIRNNSIVSGRLKDLVNLWVENGRATSGSISLWTLNAPNLKLNNTAINLYAQGMMAWESATKVYVKQAQNADKVWCTGYTDEEIATNTASGGIWEGLQAIKD